MNGQLLYSNIQESVEYISSLTGMNPDIGLVLGTGLSGLSEMIVDAVEIPYGNIPHFPVSTVESHAGKLVIGTLNGKKTVALAGRFHYYEGYTMKQLTFPIRVLAAMGIKKLILSNAAGGLKAHFKEGDLVFVKDHINLMPDNPLRGANDERLGPRFPDMLNAYDKSLRQKAIDIAQALDINCHEGVYAALPGPNLETPAEYEYLHRIGADLVGMSTVPEVLVARHSDIPVLVASIVSNSCYPIEKITETTVEQVIATVSVSAKNLEKIVYALLKE